MAMMGDNFGAAGTRVTKRLGLDDEVLAYVIQAVIGAGALDLVLALTLLSYVIIGWWSVVVFLSLVGFLVGVIVLVFGRPQQTWARILFGNLWAIGAAVPFLPVFRGGAFVALRGQLWYATIGKGAQAIIAQVGAVFDLPWWAYAALGAALFVIVIWGHWRAAVAVAVALFVVGLVLLTDGDGWLLAWDSLKGLLIPFSWPVMGFALLLALVMGKEMLFPSLEWTFKPVSLEELREVGLIGLWIPGVIGKNEPEEPLPDRTVRVEMHGNGASGRGHQERYAFLNDSDEARQFYAAVKRGESFALRTARKYGLSRSSFESLREAFRDRGWADWKDDGHHEQGLELFDEGNRVIEQIAMVGTTP